VTEIRVECLPDKMGLPSKLSKRTSGNDA